MFEKYGVVNIPLFSNPAPPQSVNRFPSRLCQNTHCYVLLITNFEVMPPDEAHNTVFKFKWYDLNLTKFLKSLKNTVVALALVSYNNKRRIHTEKCYF